MPSKIKVSDLVVKFIEEMIRQLKQKLLDKTNRKFSTSSNYNTLRESEARHSPVPGKASREEKDVNIDDWLKYGRELNKRYPIVLKDYWKEKKSVNPYCFIETVGKYLQPDELIVVSDGVGPLNCMYQAFFVKPGQRIILNNGTAQMGYGLPAAIGVAFAANKKKRIICFEGDGSLQLNLHELGVMAHHKLPIKLFLYNNGGYLSIMNTQRGLFAGKLVASTTESGISTVDFIKLARVYGFRTVKINNHCDMEKGIKKVLKNPGPVFCEINSTRDTKLTPKLMAKKLPNGQFVSPPLEDMGPFLPRDEFKKNMFIPLWQE